MQAFWQRVQALEPDAADALLKFPKGKNAPLEGFSLTRDFGIGAMGAHGH